MKLRYWILLMSGAVLVGLGISEYHVRDTRPYPPPEVAHDPAVAMEEKDGAYEISHVHGDVYSMRRKDGNWRAVYRKNDSGSVTVLRTVITD